MKIVFILACTIAYAVAQLGNFPFGSHGGKQCQHKSECQPTECCVHSPLAKRKRAGFIFSELFQHDHGYCRPTRRANESCTPIGHDPVNVELYEFHCPCEAGLECRGERVHESAHSIVHENPKCQPEEN